MALNPANALDKKLKWSDFDSIEGDPPPDGEYPQAAQTSVGLGTATGTKVDPVDGSDPTVYRLVAIPTVNIEWFKTNWVMEWVFKWDKKHQDDLLDHEQIHYLIFALAGRDCHNRLKEIKKTDYSSVDDAVADIEESFKLFSVQDIHDKYDVDTHSLPTDYPAEQKKWATAVRAAKKNGKPIRKSLEEVGLIPKPTN